MTTLLALAPLVVTVTAKPMASPPTPVLFSVMMSSTVSDVNAVVEASAYTASLKVSTMLPSASVLTTVPVKATSPSLKLTEGAVSSVLLVTDTGVSDSVVARSLPVRSLSGLVPGLT